MEEIAYQDKMKALEKKNDVQKHEIAYLEKQLKVLYQWVEIQDKIYGN